MIKNFQRFGVFLLYYMKALWIIFFLRQKTTADFQQKSAVCMNKNRIILGKHIY